MNLTKHAKIRRDQRGFANESVDLILRHGTEKKAPGGATVVFLSRQEHQRVTQEFKRAIQLLERAKRGCLIIKEGRIITMHK